MVCIFIFLHWRPTDNHRVLIDAHEQRVRAVVTHDNYIIIISIIIIIIIAIAENDVKSNKNILRTQNNLPIPSLLNRGSAAAARNQQSCVRTTSLVDSSRYYYLLFIFFCSFFITYINYNIILFSYHYNDPNINNNNNCNDNNNSLLLLSERASARVGMFAMLLILYEFIRNKSHHSAARACSQDVVTARRERYVFIRQRWRVSFGSPAVACRTPRERFTFVLTAEELTDENMRFNSYRPSSRAKVCRSIIYYIVVNEQNVEFVQTPYSGANNNNWFDAAEITWPKKRINRPRSHNILW